MYENHTCCFFGHRKINKTSELITKLTETIKNLIENKGVDTFLFGSKSEFDKLCLEVVTEQKKKNPYIKRIYVRAEYQYISESYKKYLLKNYDDTYYPKQIENSGKASYVERNQEMINKSRFCVVYYDRNYVPPKRKKSMADLCDYQPKSGTAIAYEYAVKKDKMIINVFE